MEQTLNMSVSVEKKWVDSWEKKDTEKQLTIEWMRFF